MLKNRDLPLTSGTGGVPYRYSFQGQEHDDEVKGAGNSINFEYRMHDPRIGRFFAIDPLTREYPHYTPYSFSGNKVIDCIELEGKEEYYYNLSFKDKTKSKPIISNWKRVENGWLKQTFTREYVAYFVQIKYEGHYFIFKGHWSDGKITDKFIADPDNPKWLAYRDDAWEAYKQMSKEGALILFGGGALVKLVTSMPSTPKLKEPIAEPTTEPTTAEPTVSGEQGTYAPNRPLPRNSNGTPKPDAEATGNPHTQLGTKDGRAGSYNQSREFDAGGNPVKDIDWTTHGRPELHTNPHQHNYIPNSTGGSPSRGQGVPL